MVVESRKLISWEEAQKLRIEGWKTAQLHLHSLESDDVPKLRSNEAQVLVAKAAGAGIDYVAITDHDNDRAWRKTSQHPANWIRGIEIEVHDPKIGYPIHLGALGIPSDDVSDRLLFLAHEKRDAYALAREAHAQDVLLVANHPWWGPGGHVIKPGNYWNFVEEFGLPVELNHKRSFVENMATRLAAARYHLPLVAATDSHVGTLDGVCTVAQGDTIEAFLSNIRAGNNYVVANSPHPLFHPRMMARYVMDTLESAARGGETINLGSGSGVIDRFVSSVSQFSLDHFLLRKPMQATLGVITYFAGIVYTTASNITSFSNVKPHLAKLLREG